MIDPQAIGKAGAKDIQTNPNVQKIPINLPTT